MKITDMKINPLPSLTWNWLKVNDTPVKAATELARADIQDTLEGNVSVSEIPETKVPILETSAGVEFDRYISSALPGADQFTTEKGKSAVVERTIRFHGEVAGGRSVYHAAAKSRLTILQYFGHEEQEGVQAHQEKAQFAAFDTRIVAEADAEVTLIDVIWDSDISLIDSIGGSFGQNASCRMIQILMPGARILTGVAADLSGDASRIQIDTGYQADRDELLDINYVIRHRGTHTDTKIAVNGSLRDQASKIFRGTIDFEKGSAASKGDEREDVLMISPSARNRTVPVILCAEEDVEGTHGASIGKLSEKELFYLESRGIAKEDAQELMAKSRIESAVGRIPNERIRNFLQNKLEPEE